MDREDALASLKNGSAAGVFYSTEEPSLTVAASNMETSILHMLLCAFLENKMMLMDISKEHMGGLAAAAAELSDYRELTESVTVGGESVKTDAGYYILNSLAFLMVAMSVAYLAGTLAGGMAALNGLNNVISLGMCFLGGILVPIEMLNEKVENVSRFLPTYWYAKINGILGDYADISRELMQTVRNGLLIQVLFALACLCVTMAVNKARMRE